MGLIVYIYLTLYAISFWYITRDEEKMLEYVNYWISPKMYFIVAAICSLFLWGIYGIISDVYNWLMLQLTIWRVKKILKQAQKRHNNEPDNQ